VLVVRRIWEQVREVVPKRTRSGSGEDTFVTMTYCGPILTIWGKHDAFLPPETNVEVRCFPPLPPRPLFTLVAIMVHNGM